MDKREGEKGGEGGERKQREVSKRVGEDRVRG